MQTKRGQVTIFLIIGIITLFVLAFLFFARDLVFEQLTRSTNIEKRFSATLETLRRDIDRCVTHETTTALTQLGERGGYFTPLRTLSYYGRRFTYLCTQLPGHSYCAQQLLTKEDLQNRLNNRLTETLSSCIDLRPYQNRDYTFTTGTLHVSTTILPKTVLVNITYPVTFTKESVTVTRDRYTYHVPIPFGDVLNAAHDILNQEATFGYFDPLSYSYLHRSKYDVEKHIPYPHRVYVVREYGYPYQFQFAIEGRKTR